MYCKADGSHIEVAFNKFNKRPTMDPKLTILLMLIGAVIVLSHLTAGNLRRLRRQFVDRRWRKMMPLRRRS